MKRHLKLSGLVSVIGKGVVRVCSFAFCAGIVLDASAAWTYDASKKTLSDGNWKFGVTVSGNAITVSSRSAGSGDLILTDDLVDTAGNPLADVYIDKFTAKVAGSVSGTVNFTLSKLTEIGNNVFDRSSTHPTKFVFNVPSCKRLGDLCLFRILQYATESRFDDWDFSGLETLGNTICNNGLGSTTGPTGTLRFPKLKTLEDAVTVQGGFNCIGPSTVIIGDPNEETGIEYLNQMFFAQCGVTNVQVYSRSFTTLPALCFHMTSTLKSFTLGGMSVTTVESDRTFGTSVLDELIVLGAVPPSEALANLAKFTGDYKVWRVSTKMGTWKTSLSGLITDKATIESTYATQYAELSDADKNDLIGLWPQSGSKRIWIVQKASPYESSSEVTVEVRGLDADTGDTLTIGTASPAYGATTQTIGKEVQFSVSAYGGSGDVLYAPVGYVREVMSGEEYGAPTTNLNVTSFTETIGSSNMRISWLFRSCGYKLTVKTLQRDVSPSWTPAPTAEGGYYLAGTVVTVSTPLTNTAYPRNKFSFWRGAASAGEDPTVATVTMDAPQTVEAVYDTYWYWNPTKRTLDDGNWKFTLDSGNGGTNFYVKTRNGGSGELYLDDGKFVDLEGAALASGPSITNITASLSGAAENEVVFNLKHLMTISGQILRETSKSITNIVVNSPEFATISALAFYRIGNGSLAYFTLGGRCFRAFDDPSVDNRSRVFEWASFKELKILGAVPSDEVLANLAGKTGSYSFWLVSKHQGWSNLPGLIRDKETIATTYAAEFAKLTDEQKERVIGLYVHATAKKNIWLLDTPSPYDRTGTMIIIR